MSEERGSYHIDRKSHPMADLIARRDRAMAAHNDAFDAMTKATRETWESARGTYHARRAELRAVEVDMDTLWDSFKG